MKNGCVKITAHVQAWNKAALGLYKKIGFNVKSEKFYGYNSSIPFFKTKKSIPIEFFAEPIEEFTFKKAETLKETQ